MKIFKFILVLLFTTQVNAQIVLNMPEVIQEENQWCWAGVTKSILNYYGESVNQCEIADYARQRITWHDFGNTNCCENSNLGCNYWNYAYGSNGSMQDILVHFGNIQNQGIANDLTLSQINTKLSENKPFIVRWGWNSGGGHFVIGHGIDGNSIYYMNPWFGEGLHISTYNWLKNGGNHTWTHTNVITTASVANINENEIESIITIFPNPASNNVRINCLKDIDKITIFNSLGEKVLSSTNKNMDISFLSNGIYIVKTFIGSSIISKKLIVK